MAARTIQCEDCGADYETVRANTKYCQVCRLFRFASYNGERTSTCWACDKPFSPLSKGATVCGSCSPSSASATTGKCAFCGTSGKLTGKDVAVCPSCATDPNQRALFVRSLKQKIDAQHASAA